MDLKPIFKKYTDLRSVNIAFVVLWVPFLAIYIYYSISLLKYPYEWEPAEGSKILYAQRLIEGKPVYKSNRTFPMLGNCYPPVYTIAVAPFVAVGGPYLVWGRLVSVLAILIMCWLIYKIARETTGSVCLGIIAICCFVFVPIISSWYSLARMDSLCAMFILICAYILFKYRDSAIAVIVSAVFAVLALYTKQTAMFTVGTVTLFLLFKKRFRDFFLFLSVATVLSILFFLVLQWITGGWFYKNVFGENVHRLFFARRYTAFFGWLFSYAPVVIIFAVFGLIKKLKTRKPDIWVFYFAGGLCNALLIGANGSGYNYFFTFWSAVSIFFVEAIAHLENKIVPGWRGKKSAVRLSAISLILLLSLINFQGKKAGLIYRNSLLDFVPTEFDLKSMRQLEAYIVNSTGNIFVDRVPSITLKCNKNQYYMEPAFIQELYFAGAWDPSYMMKMVAGKDFSAIFLMSESLVPYQVKESIKNNYSPVTSIKIGTFEVWRDQYIIVYRPKIGE